MSNTAVGVAVDLEAIKSWSKSLQKAPGCELEINDPQLVRLTESSKKETTLRVVGNVRQTLSLKTLESCKYCDIKVHLHDEDDEIKTRLMWSPAGFGNTLTTTGVMVIYNPVITDIIGKFAQIAVPIHWTTYPSRKIPKIVLLDTENIFVPFQDMISHNRFISEENRKRIKEHTPRLLKYFNDYLYKIWAPILVDNFKSSYQLPKRPKKPDLWICNDNPEENHSWVFDTLVKCTFPNLKVDINDTEELITAFAENVKPESMTKFENLFREIVGDEIYMKGVNAGRDVIKTIEPAIADEIDKYVETRYGPKEQTTEPTPEPEPITETTEPTPPTEPKVYEDSLDGFFELLNDM